MEARTGPVDQPGEGGLESDWSAETVAAVFRALESIDKNVSPQLARSVQARINAVKLIGREFGLLTESESAEVLGPGVDNDLHYFTLRYRGQTLYPGFLFEPLPTGAGAKRMLPLLRDLKEIADKYKRDGSDVVFWLTSPSSWFADGGRPVDHLNEPSRVLAAFEDSVGTQ